ncbi:MFS transporter [Paenibacillus sp. FSL K6-2859]|uniref:MFS transporter n=1 Tax=Paenibacillus sp. FSL K6-2859 TaxID=2921482 RepID=UPI0030F8A52E
MTGASIKGQVLTPFRRLTFGILLGYGMMMLALMTPATLLLTFKMIEVDPNGYTSSYGLVAGIGAIFALIGNPIGGALSDRTHLSFGRRRTWIILGPLVGCTALVCTGFANEPWQIMISWAVAQFFFNVGMAAYTALIPDHVSQEKQGTISGLIGLTIPIAMTVGMIMMTVMTSVSSEIKWLLLGVIGIIGPLLSTLIIKEGKVELVPKTNNQISLGKKLSTIFPSPRKFPEFSWAFVSKFLIMMGYCSTLYLTVMLVNRMGLTEELATAKVATINIVMLVGVAITSIFGGVLSDKFGKQKPFLIVSGFIIAIGVLLFAFVPSYPAYIAGAAVIGLGFGCFSAVDMALVARILPSKEDSAKDFGIMNVANALPQSIVPAIAPVLLGIGSWTFFYIFLAVCTIFGMLAVKPLPEVGTEKRAQTAELTAVETQSQKANLV